MDRTELAEFVRPYYEHKDIMHNMWHIELVLKWLDRVIALGNYEVDYECLIYAAYFHGFIYSDEKAIREWLCAHKIDNERIDKIITISWKSQRPTVPRSLEGKILHDAHVLEGGKKQMLSPEILLRSLVKILNNTF